MISVLTSGSSAAKDFFQQVHRLCHFRVQEWIDIIAASYNRPRNWIKPDKVTASRFDSFFMQLLHAIHTEFFVSKDLFWSWSQ